MSGIESLLNMGQKALNASQVGIQVTGQNISNVNTAGYSRQRVLFEADIYLDNNPGQMGTGVKATEIQRLFDAYLEKAYNLKASSRDRYNALYSGLTSVESTFNESTNGGIGACLSTFFDDWSKLSTAPGQYPLRQTLLSDTTNLMGVLAQSDADLLALQSQANQQITQDVKTANEIMARIADINGELSMTDAPGGQNANGLLDQRDTLVRSLATLIDVTTVDNGGGDFTVLTKAGQTLVDRTRAFDLKLESNKVIRNLPATSNFDGTVGFSGQDDFEYTLKVVQGGTVSNGAGAAQFQVSLDGGVTWLTSGSGEIQTFSARPESGKVDVGNLQIYFGKLSNTSLSPTGQLNKGDTFTVVPKSGLFWYQSAATPINITPQTAFNGQDNNQRVTGGELGGLFTLRDYNLGRYRERLDTLTKGVIWETNRIHSQGAGLEHFSAVTGTYSVRNASTPLASPSTGLSFGDRLASGASTMYVYNAQTGELVSNGFLNFNFSGGGELELFDPSKHSLTDVVTAINNTFGSFLTASVSNNQLEIQGKPGYSFGFGSDAAGLYAALGVNTFFTGDSAATMGVNSVCGSNSDFVNAGHINGAGEGNTGDNATALDIAALRTKEVTLYASYEKPTQTTLTSYYNGLVGVVGVDTENAKFNYTYQSSLASDYYNRQLEISGVNMDEEMSNLIKFQHSYQAAAKMISTADQMWQTVLGLKQ